MFNSTIVSNISGALPPSQKVSSGVRASLLVPVEFTMADVKTNSVSPADQKKFLQKQSTGKASNLIFNGQKKGNLDQNKNPQVKLQLVNGNKNGVDDDMVPCPKVCLYSGKINSEWQKMHKIGAGLTNFGNTCFMNTVLQCLTYTPPLANYLLHDSDHSSKCKLTGFCMMCELQQHMKRTIDRTGDVIKPAHIYQKLKAIAKHFQFGRQEDAHEFLRYVIDNLWKSCLSNFDGHTKLDPASKETTVINQIFGGYHRSQVTCLKCKEKSNTYDHFMDFILDVKQNVVTLERALEKYIQPELLQNENAYKCPQCKMKVSAHKKFTVYKAPNVATFQFKRFDYNRMCGGKITKHISYPENLNLRPYMSVTKGPPVLYRLNAVLVHLGQTCNSGHYFCYVRGSNGFWYIMDDQRVQQVSVNQVLNQVAYVLFYVRTNPEYTITKKPAEQSPAIARNSHLVKNGYIDRTNCVSSHTVARPAPSVKIPLPGFSKLSIAESKSGVCNGSSSNANIKKVLQPLSQNREKISFTVGPAENVNKLLVDTKSKKTENTNSKQSSPASNNSVLNGNILVPYIEDSSDSSDDVKNDNSPSPVKNQNFTNVNKISSPSSLSQTPQKSDMSSLMSNASSHDSNKNLVIECRAKSRLSSNLKESFKDRTMCHNQSLPKVDKLHNQNLSSLSGGSEKKKDFLTEKNQLTKCKNVTNKASLIEESEISNGNKISNVNTSDNIFDSNIGFSSAPSVKVNATSSQWTATDISLHSPSVASGSSTNSVNSTTDWSVTDQDAASRKKDRCNTSLWTVQVRSLDRNHKTQIHKNEIRQKCEDYNDELPISKTVSPKVKENMVAIKISVKNKKIDKKVDSNDQVQQNGCSTEVANTSNIEVSDLVQETSSNFIQPLEERKVTSKAKPFERPPTPFRTLGSPVFKERHQREFQKPLIGKDDFQDQPFHAPQKESFLASMGESNKSVSPHSERHQQNIKVKEQKSCKRSFSDVTKDACEKRPTRLHDAHENSNGSVSKKFKAEHNDFKDERKHSPLKNGAAGEKHLSSTLSKPPNNTHNSPTSEKQLKNNLTPTKTIKEEKRSRSSKDNCSVTSTSSYETVSVAGKKVSNAHNSSNKSTHRTKNSSRRSYSDSEGYESDKNIDKISSCSSSSVEYEWVEKTKETLTKDKFTKDSKKKLEKGESRYNSFSYNEDNSQRNPNYIFGKDIGTWDGSNRSENHVTNNHQKRYFDSYDEEIDRGKVRLKKKKYMNNDRKYNLFDEYERKRNKNDFQGSWRPKPFHNRTYPVYRKDKYYDRQRKNDFKYRPKMFNKHHRHYRQH